MSQTSQRQMEVKNLDRARTMAADQIHGRSDHPGCGRDVAVGPAQILAPRGPEHTRRRGGLIAPFGDVPLLDISPR